MLQAVNSQRLADEARSAFAEAQMHKGLAQKHRRATARSMERFQLLKQRCEEYGIQLVIDNQ